MGKSDFYLYLAKRTQCPTFLENPGKIFLIYIDNIILNFILKANEITVANMTLKNKNKVGRLNLSDFKTIIVALIKTVWYWQRGRQIDKCNRSENT